MKKALLLCLSLLALSGCAAMQNAPGTETVIDYQKVDLVDQWARRNSVTVIWMNLPTRTAPVATAGANRNS